MRKLICVLLLPCFLLFCGCKQTAVISREDQLSLLTQGRSPQSDTTETAETTAVTASGESTAGTFPRQAETSVGTETTDAAESQDISEAGSANPSEAAGASSGDGETPPEARDVPSSTAGSVETTPSETIPDETAEPPETIPVSEAATTPQKDPYDISDYTIGSLEYDICAATNDLRTADGLPELTLDGELCAIASIRAYECSLYWSHTRPDGTDWSSIFSLYGYSGYTVAAENLLQTNGSTDAASVVAAWRNSSGHRANMCNGEYTRMGAGIYSANGITYVVCFYTD